MAPGMLLSCIIHVRYIEERGKHHGNNACICIEGRAILKQQHSHRMYKLADGVSRRLSPILGAHTNDEHITARQFKS